MISWEQYFIGLALGILIALLFFRWRHGEPGAPRFYFSRITWTGIFVEGRITKVNLRDDQKVTATVSFVDAKGAAADIQPGSAAWSTSDASIAAVTQDPTNEKSAEIVAGTPPPANPDGTPGPAAVIQVSAKDLDGNAITAQGSVNVVAGDATVGSLNFGVPVHQ